MVLELDMTKELIRGYEYLLRKIDFNSVIY